MSLLRIGGAFLLILSLFSGCRTDSRQLEEKITGDDGLISAEYFLKEDSVIHFWKIREIAGRGTLSVQEGILGNTARNFEVYEKDQGLLLKKATELVSDIRKKGYRSYGPEAYQHIIIQVDTTYWGSVSDIEKLAFVEDLLNSALTGSGNGRCTGSDIASKVSFFAVVFDAAIASQTILKALRDNGVELPVVIAIEKGNDIKVLWPENFQGEFSLI